MNGEAGRFRSLTREPWWREAGMTRFVAGVFEGGGAKGLLYRGALEAMVEDGDRPCWFAAAAGSSAGAITATLIAAGLHPTQVADEAAKALAALRKPRSLNGLLRVHAGASYLDQDSLADWLHGVLERQIHELCGEDGGASVTFEELYQLTGIELDVVAVDLKRQRLVVFNYELTPRCRVGDAVVASAAIPIAFEWRPLQLSQPPFGIIVDGGVMANFPTFVFKDRSFREWAGLPPHPASVPVLGFLLDEQDRAEVTQADLYRESGFWPPMSQLSSHVEAVDTNGDAQLPAGFEPDRRRFRPRPEPSTGSSLARTLRRPLRVALSPVWRLLFDWIPRALCWNASVPPANWPQPRNAVVRAVVRVLDGLLVATRHPAFFLGGFLAATFCIAVGAYFVAWRPLAGHVGDVIDGDVSIAGAAVGLAVLTAWSLVPIYAWMVISIVFFTGWLIHQTLRTTGYGLVKTFLQGPAAPLWAGEADDDHVVRLPVPPGLTTLPDRIDERELAAAVEEARQVAATTLSQLEFPRE